MGTRATAMTETACSCSGCKQGHSDPLAIAIYDAGRDERCKNGWSPATAARKIGADELELGKWLSEGLSGAPLGAAMRLPGADVDFTLFTTRLGPWRGIGNWKVHVNRQGALLEEGVEKLEEDCEREYRKMEKLRRKKVVNLVKLTSGRYRDVSAVRMPADHHTDRGERKLN